MKLEHESMIKKINKERNTNDEEISQHEKKPPSSCYIREFPRKFNKRVSLFDVK